MSTCLSINVQPASSSSSMASTNPNSPTTPQNNRPQDPISPPNTPKRSVRFRSRVRITSGLHRHKKHHRRSPPTSSSVNDTSAGLSPDDAQRYPYLHYNETSSDSSASSSSPSSSISAPLKYRRDSASTYTDERNGGGSGDTRKRWKPLGQRINYLRASRAAAAAQERRSGERTALLNNGNRNGVGGRRYDDTPTTHESDEPEDEYQREIDIVFGTWPKRIFNPFWWWWSIEPIMCCLCTYTEEDPEVT